MTDLVARDQVERVVAGGAGLQHAVGARADRDRIGRHTGRAERDQLHVVATRDHHVEPGAHFSAAPDWVDSWPPHCRAGTPGASFHPDLDVAGIEAVFDKGERTAAYSGFEGRHIDGSSLSEWLATQEVTDIDVCGLTTDHCVRETSLDGIRNGFNTRVLIDLCAGVLPRTTDAAIQAMRSAGVKLT